MEKYVFSGSLTKSMHDYLQAMPDFEPLDILITQLDRSAIKTTIEWKKEGFCRWLFIDSGAFSIHTGKAKLPGWKGTEPPTFKDFEQAYIEYLNSIDEYVDVCAQLDTIPGEFGKPKSKEDYEESAKKSWGNFLYMRTQLKSPDKVMPVFHFGESFDVLKQMLEWTDENGNHLDYVGISPANDASQEEKNIYLGEVEQVIAASSDPDVKVHFFGMTSLDALSKYKCYSADSISHRQIAGYCKIWSPTFGVISVSKRTRTTSTKSNLSFLDTADEFNLEILRKEVEATGLTMELIEESSSARTAFTMHSIQQLIAGKYKYEEKKVKKPKKLFNM